MLNRFQVLMNKSHGNRPFANGGGHPFDRSMANVAGSEDTRAAGFQQIGVARERPAYWSLPFFI
jgi:hypothetical protein